MRKGVFGGGTENTLRGAGAPMKRSFAASREIFPLCFRASAGELLRCAGVEDPDELFGGLGEFGAGAEGGDGSGPAEKVGPAEMTAATRRDYGVTTCTL